MLRQWLKVRIDSGRAGLVMALSIALAQLVRLSSGGAEPFKDDAFISLQYAKNFVSGNGLVFNAGEIVEGFTNPLWTLISSGILAAQLPEVLSLKVLGGLAYLGLIYSSWLAAKAAGVQGWFRCAPAMIIACSGAAAYWALSGMETIAFALAVCEGARHFILAVRAGKRGSPGGGFWLGVAVLLRPEAVAYFIIFALLLRFWKHPGAEYPAAGQEGEATPSTCNGSFSQPFSSGHSIGAMWLWFIVPVLAWELFRLTYYHAWLPNTFYAKVGVSLPGLIVGLQYLLKSLPASAWGLLLFFLLLAPRAWKRPGVAMPLSIFLFQMLYIITVGGDYMPMGRFILPVLPLIAVSWTAAFSEAANGFATTVALEGRKKLYLLIVLCFYGMAVYVMPYGCQEPDIFTQRYTRAGKWLAKNIMPGTLVATPAIGAVGYFGNVRILDEFGLIDPFIADYKDVRTADQLYSSGHSRVNTGYVLQRRPEIILIGNIWIRPNPLVPQTAQANAQFFPACDKLLFLEPEFFKSYQIVSFRLEDNQWFGMALRRDSIYHPAHRDYRWSMEYVFGS